MGGRGRPARRRRRRRRRSRSRATRSAAAGRRCCRGRRRCSSARGRGRGREAPSAPPRRGGRRWSRRGSRSARSGGGRPARGRPRRPRASSVSAASSAQRDLVDLLAQLAVRGDGLAQAADDDRAGVEAGVERQARVDPAVDLAHVGERRRRLLGQLVGQAVDDRDRDRPPAARWRAAQRRQATRSPAVVEQLHQLHRRQHQREPARRASKLAGVADGGARRQAGARGALVEGGDQVRVEVEADASGGRAGRGASATRPVPQPRSRIGPPTALARAPPRARRSPLVGAALDVVPDRGTAASVWRPLIARTPSPGRATASSLRSSSRAV